MKLIFINRYFYPDHSATSQMLSDLAFALAAKGEEIVVITSRQLYDSQTERLASAETTNGVRIIRVWTSRFGRANLIGRAVDYLTFYLSAGIAMLGSVRRNDLVIAKTDPPMLSVIAHPLSRLRGALLVNWLQDLFPEVAEAVAGDEGSRLARVCYGALRVLRNWSLNAAAMNVAIGEGMAERLRRLGVAPARICVIPNWADGDSIQPTHDAALPLRKQWGLDGAFVVGYSGNLGRAHDHATILEAMSHLEREYAAVEADGSTAIRRRGGCLGGAAGDRIADRPIVWLFVGGGAGLETLKRDVAQRRLSCVVFKPYQPRSTLAASLGVADVHLVTLRPELEGLIVPSKYYGIAAAGRPTIFIGAPDGEIGRELVRSEGGLSVPQGDAAALAGAVMTLARDPERRQRMGANSRRTFERAFSKDLAVERWRAALRRVSQGQSASESR